MSIALVKGQSSPFQPEAVQTAASVAPPRIHSSALVAGAAYVVGITLALPAAAHASTTIPLLTEFELAGPWLLFLTLVAGLQLYMGMPLHRNRTSTPPLLCTSGPFRYSRNPIYLAFCIPLAALVVFSVTAAATSIAIYIICMRRFVIRGEERELALTFGDQFERYRAVTPRWLII